MKDIVTTRHTSTFRNADVVSAVSLQNLTLRAMRLLLLLLLLLNRTYEYGIEITSIICKTEIVFYFDDCWFRYLGIHAALMEREARVPRKRHRYTKVSMKSISTHDGRDRGTVIGAHIVLNTVCII